MNEPQIIVHTEKNLMYTPFDAKWMPKSAKIIVLGSYAKATGAFEIYELENGSLKLLDSKEFPNALMCGTFGAASYEERHIATGDFNGKLQVHDITNLNAPVYCADAHSQTINCIDGVGGLNIGKGAPEIVTGSKDGYVKLWDQRQKNSPVLSIEPETAKEKRDCWSVSFGNSFSDLDRTISVGFDNGDLKIFDLRTMGILWEIQLNNGICSVQFDRKDIQMNKLVATTLESSICVFDLRTFNDKKGFASMSVKAHKSTVWSGQHLPQDRDIFMSTGGNGSLNLWKYIYPSNRVEKLEDGTSVGVMGQLNCLKKIQISSQPVTKFDWSLDKKGLGACIGLDQIIRVVLVTKLNTC